MVASSWPATRRTSRAWRRGPPGRAWSAQGGGQVGVEPVQLRVGRDAQAEGGAGVPQGPQDPGVDPAAAGRLPWRARASASRHRQSRGRGVLGDEVQDGPRGDVGGLGARRGRGRPGADAVVMAATPSAGGRPRARARPGHRRPGRPGGRRAGKLRPIATAEDNRSPPARIL